MQKKMWLQQIQCCFYQGCILTIQISFQVVKSEFWEDSFEPEIVFTLQEKRVDSVPDATITQDGFKIVVETKMPD